MHEQPAVIAAPEPLCEDAVLVAVSGEVTFANVADLKDALQRALGHGRDRVVIDITEVGFLDSSAMSALLKASVEASKDGRSVVVVHAGAEPPGIFRFKGVERLLRLYPSREAAVQG
jgi:anti-sigma B factor antagonist